MACAACLLLLWEPVQAALLSFLGTAVADSLSSLRDWGVARLRGLTLFWGNQVEQVPISSGDLVGTETIHGHMQQIGGYLKDDRERVIGIYGMGGVGKTTLLEMINNKFPEIGAPRFEVVIWVTVSQDANIRKIQKSIGDRLNLTPSAEDQEPASSSPQVEEQAKAIFKALSNRRFLLLLDDVWKKLDLKLVGVPLPTAENKCKIILTTRSRQVCHDMGATKKVNVEKLDQSNSWQLFKKKAGTGGHLDNPAIKQIAEAVADKCGGLPLALITVGCAMAEARSVGEWREALVQLKESPYELPGMKEEVLSLIKFSFDRLEDETIKECLLYCCLFPEDEEIPVEQVVEYWLWEGFLDNPQSNSIVRARNRGHGVITRLKSAGLLLEIESEGFLFEFGRVSCVKLHDVVREMCLWLTGAENDKSTFLVYAGRDDLAHVPIFEKWGDAKRISLMCSVLDVRRRHVPSCPNLQTFLCNSARLSNIHEGFFRFMPILRVLDLSSTGLQSLPDEISFLGELRYLNLSGTRITSLPDVISFLGELRYLNLSGTRITSLPKGLAKLVNLRMLNLDKTRVLSHIPQEVFPTLTGLQDLGLYESGYNFVWQIEPSASLLGDNGHIQSEGTSSSSSYAQVSMRSIEGSWDKLEELRLTVSTSSSLETLLNSDKLCQCTVKLKIDDGFESDISSSYPLLSIDLERLERLQSLYVVGNLSNVEFSESGKFQSSLQHLELEYMGEITIPVTSPPLFGSLRRLVIMNCTGIRDLMWVRQLPYLKLIVIENCEAMEEILPVEDGLEGVSEALDCDCSSLLELRELHVIDLPNLRSISQIPMLFPSLEVLGVYRCPQLKKLPLEPGSAKKIRKIFCEPEFWESLNWYQDVDGQSVKSRFLPFFLRM